VQSVSQKALITNIKLTDEGRKWFKSVSFQPKQKQTLMTMCKKSKLV